MINYYWEQLDKDEGQNVWEKSGIKMEIHGRSGSLERGNPMPEDLSSKTYPRLYQRLISSSGVHLTHIHPLPTVWLSRIIESTRQQFHWESMQIPYGKFKWQFPDAR
uniref:Pcm protein n=1 Tax=Fopius arisanus TaxID=64838 RepID=A0A0C9RG03_9HYME